MSRWPWPVKVAFSPADVWTGESSGESAVGVPGRETRVKIPFGKSSRDDQDASPQQAEEKRADRKRLAERLRDRDPSALEWMYDRNSGRAFGLAYRILGDGPAAEDVVQDAFLWVWNNPERIDPERGSAEALLMTLVHRRSIDALRARNRRNALHQDSMVPEQVAAASDLFESVARNLSHQHVRDTLESLSMDQQRVIDLAYFGGLTHQEISDQLGIPLGTVKSRLRLGLNRLRTAFGLGGEQ